MIKNLRIKSLPKKFKTAKSVHLINVGKDLTLQNMHLTVTCKVKKRKKHKLTNKN